MDAAREGEEHRDRVAADLMESAMSLARASSLRRVAIGILSSIAVVAVPTSAARVTSSGASFAAAAKADDDEDVSLMLRCASAFIRSRSCRLY